MNNTITDAETYKAGLPRNGRGVKWTMESFSTYVNLRYPHITVISGQEWINVPTKYKLFCNIHGTYEQNAQKVVSLYSGCQCIGCSIDKCVASAGTVERKRGSREEKQLAQQLRDDGMSYNAIAKQLGRSNATICYWLNPDANARNNATTKQWTEKNPERFKENCRRYYSDFEHGRASRNASGALNRLRKQNSPEEVFLDGKWFEVDRKETWRVFKDYLLPPKERKAIQEVYLEAQHQTEITGVTHHVDHIWPLSKSGEHLLNNLQVITGDENLDKRAEFEPEHQRLFLDRIDFG